MENWLPITKIKAKELGKGFGISEKYIDDLCKDTNTLEYNFFQKGDIVKQQTDEHLNVICLGIIAFRKKKKIVDGKQCHLKLIYGGKHED